MKSTMGHPSRLAAIQAMKREGLGEKQIATRLGIKPNTVSSMISRAKRRGSIGHGVQPRIRVRGDLLADLGDEAAKRGTTPEVLASAILRAVIDDELFTAVLDV